MAAINSTKMRPHSIMQQVMVTPNFSLIKGPSKVLGLLRFLLNRNLLSANHWHNYAQVLQIQ